MAVDLDAKSLVWFCEAPVDDCLSTIEALLPLQRVLWPGWSVQWAARGLDDLLLAAGLPARRPNFEEFEAGQTGYRQLGPGGPVVDIAERYELAFAKMIAEPTEETFGVASLRGTDGSRKLYPLGEAGIESILEYGPGRTIRALEQRLSHPSVTLSAAECSAQAGFDIDAQGRVLSLWSSDQIWTNHFRKVWEGWTIVDWGTDYGAHQTLLDGRLRVDFVPTDEILELLEKYLVPDCEHYEPYEIEHPGQTERIKAAFPIDLPERRRRWHQAVQTALP